MSDPVTNVEIEDVLSSIRKLVSQGEEARVRDSDPGVHTDAQDGDRAADPTPESTPAPESKPEKLVLSPAFRVSNGEEDPAGQAATAPEQDHEPAAEETGTEQDRSEADAAETSLAEVEAPAQIVWTDTGDDMTPEEGLADEAATDEAEPVAEEPSPESSPEASMAQAEPAGDERRSSLEAAIAELEASVGGDEFEPDGSEEAETVAAMAWPGHHPRASEAVEEAELAEEAETAPTADPAVDAAGAPDEVPGNEGDDGLDDIDAVDIEDDAELEALLSDAGAIDEDALRDLVTEIVRQELQGPMGERITRNVRKLVRREIYRILASQDFQ